MFDLRFLTDRPLIALGEIKSVLRRVLHDQPVIYVQSDDGTRKEASQQEVVSVVVSRIADELGIRLE